MRRNVVRPRLLCSSTVACMSASRTMAARLNALQGGPGHHSHAATPSNSSVAPSVMPLGADWREAYALLHAKHLNESSGLRHSRQQPQQQKRHHRLIFVVREGTWRGRKSGGLADRMTGLITAFAVALVTKTPFFIDWPGLYHAYKPHSIAWACDGCADTALANGAPFLNFVVQKARLGHGVYQRLHPLAARHLVRQALHNVTAAIGNAARTGGAVVWREAAGALYQLIDGSNPTHGAFRAMGLNLSSAFRELHRFLFAHSMPLRAAFATELSAVEVGGGATLLQIRMGDQQMQTEEEGAASGRSLLTHWASSFACASSLGSRAIFLMSDSQALKQHVAKHWETLRPGRSEMLITHATDSHKPTSRWYDYDAAALVGVAGEREVASRCTRHVISQGSGLGMQAFFLSRAATIEQVWLLPNCTHPLSLEELAASWSGI